MPVVTITELDNAKTDVDHIANVATSLEVTAVDRLGHTKDTLAGAMYKIQGITNRGAWASATAYASKDIVSESGTWYICVVAHTSSVAFATDSAAKWRVYQGVTSGDLAASSGSDMVGFLQSGAGAVARKLQAKNREIVSVTDFGATLNGIADDTAAFNAAIAALPAAGGTVFVPPGIPTLNITITKRGVRLAGCSQTADRSFTSNYWKPFDVTLPVVQIGDDSTIVSGCSLEYISFYGNGTGHIGLALAGGAYRNNFHNVSAHDFTLHNVKLLSGVNPVAKNQFVNGHINASITGSRGLFAGVGAGGSYCEANGFTNYEISGPGTSGYAVENDSSNSLFMSNVWIQAQNNCGVKFTKSFAVLPKIRCANVFVDTDLSTDASVEGYNTAIVNLSDLMIGLVEVDGKLKLSDGSLVTGIRNYGAWMPFQTNFAFPMVYGTMKFLNGTSAASMDPTTYGGSVACSSGNWDFTAQLGPMRFASTAASGVQLGSDSVYRYQATTASFRPMVDDTYDLGSSSQRWRTVLTKTVKHTALTVATLPSASGSGAGAKAFVTDATVTTFASVVAGGGANGVPVYSDGTNWRIG